MANLTFSDNAAAKYGGAIYNSGTLSVGDSTIFTLNRAAEGGAIYGYGGSLTIEDTMISGNSALDYGGGICHYFGTVTLTNSTISGNSAAYDGGGIFSQGGLTIADSTLSANSAANDGGGIYHYDGMMTIAHSTISDNEGVLGGGICSIEGTLSVVSSTISGNSAWADGGGVYSQGGLTIADSTISGNSAWGGGGGVWASSVWWSSPLVVVNSTIVENAADANDSGRPFGVGGGVHAEDYADRPPTLHHTIVAGNLRGAAEAVSDDLWLTADEASSHNLIGDEASSGSLINGVNGNIAGVGDLSWLAPLGDYGGTTQTHALLPGSPAIDAGDPYFDPNSFEPPLENDQRGDGFARMAGRAVDIGAYEVQLVVTTLDDEDDGDHSPDDLSLREALGLLGPGKDTILFATDLAGGTITLDADLGPLQITSNVDLVGMGVALDAAGDCGVLVVDAAVTDARIRDLTIREGNAQFGGGIRNEGTLSVVGSTISGNSASSDGGGIYNTSGGTLWVTNSTISGNSAAESGGGIYNSGTLWVLNSTISGSSATSDGGGVHTDSDAATTLHNTIVAGNLSNTPDADDLSGDVLAGSSYNLVGDAASSGGLVDKNDEQGENHGNIVGVADLAWLSPLGDYGGPTQTHALLLDSPAIDAGDPDFDPNVFDPPLLTDQRGEGSARIVGGGLDIGAFEYQESFIVTTLADEDDGDLGAGDFSLREALGRAASNPDVTIDFAPSLTGGTITLDPAVGPAADRQQSGSGRSRR